MKELVEERKCERIETTLGDLIFAISEAALEAKVSEEEMGAYLQTILSDVLDRYQQ